MCAGARLAGKQPAAAPAYLQDAAGQFIYNVNGVPMVSTSWGWRFWLGLADLAPGWPGLAGGRCSACQPLGPRPPARPRARAQVPGPSRPRGRRCVPPRRTQVLALDGGDAATYQAVVQAPAGVELQAGGRAAAEPGEGDAGRGATRAQEGRVAAG
jgi:hypothetical protein